jgi:hypothetical protein
MVLEALEVIAATTNILADAGTVQDATIDQGSEKPSEVCIMN